MVKTKMFLRNFVSIPIGIVTFFVALFITTAIEELLLQVPFLISILSWPSTPELYLASITMITSSQISLWAARAVCGESDSGKRVGYLIFAGIMGAFYFIGAIFELTAGWKDTILGMFLAAGSFIIMFIDELHE